MNSHHILSKVMYSSGFIQNLTFEKERKCSFCTDFFILCLKAQIYIWFKVYFDPKTHFVKKSEANRVKSHVK